MWSVLLPALASLVGMKYQSNIANDPKAAIGSGTSPTMNPGDGGQFNPVAGSEVNDFADFSFEDPSSPNTEGGSEEEQVLQMLMEAGIDPEELGIMGLAFGGPLKREDGGSIFNSLISGIGSLFSNSEPLLEAGVHPVPDYQDTLPEEAAPLDGIKGYAEENPEMFKALIDAGLITGKNLINKPKEQAGSMVRTNTLAGNAARRRSQFDNITPLSGSQVTFANEGSALNRKMFMDNQMPNGGAMYGPGGPKDDLIPVMASNGEYMLSKAAVDAAGNGSHAMGIANLEKFNNAGNKRYG